jgi:hypothetical protein
MAWPKGFFSHCKMARTCLLSIHGNDFLDDRFSLLADETGAGKLIHVANKK